MTWIPIREIRGTIGRREIVGSGRVVGLLYLILDEAAMSPAASGGRTVEPVTEEDF